MDFADEKLHDRDKPQEHGDPDAPRRGRTRAPGAGLPRFERERPECSGTEIDARVAHHLEVLSRPPTRA